MWVSIITLIGQLLTVAVRVMDLFFAERAKAQAEQKEYELNQESARLLIEAAILKMRNDTTTDNEQIGNSDDAVDKELSGGRK